MNARSLARLAPHATLTLVCSALALLLPACDCAGNTMRPTSDAGDTGVTGDSGPPRDTGPDTGVHLDGGRDTGTMTDGGACANPETCNGTDDDCDGLIDENIVVSCGSDVGICRSGTQTCAAGTLGACMGGMSAAAAEVCGNGLDDNCDGTTDEGCGCTNGATQACGSGVGTCVRGTQTCASGAWGACVGETTPTAELCDGLDNNCDGQTDEIFGGLGGTCDGPDTDLCMEGVTACSADHLSTTCTDMTSDNVEACNGLDDNCNGTVDEGCTCVDGTTQMCGVSTGACTTGTQTCGGGVWGSCVGGVGPMAEICNGVDDNCNGTTDEGFTLGGMCDGPDTDFCTEGAWVCDVSGGMICSDMTGNNVETCNAIDDNCDGVIDEGFMLGVACDGPDTDMCNEGTNMCNVAGGSTCSDMTGNSVEICNGVDDDCDGTIDEGNPGGGVTCPGGMNVGTCASQTACVAGTLVCRGTFVSAAGLATNSGASNAPLSSITAAIANAVIIGGGVDVCVCDPPGGATSTFTEDVTMVEGVSVLGGLDCNAWLLNGTSVTSVQDVDVDGLAFPAAITAVTALDHMTVVGFDDATAGATTSAITVTDSSPTLSTDTVRAGRASTAIGLRIVHAGAATSPAVTNGNYSAAGIVGGTSIAVSIESASPSFNAVTIGGGAPSGIAGSPTLAYGVDCSGCAGTTFTAGSIGTGGATMTGYGFFGSGNLAGMTMTNTFVNGGLTSANSSTSAGVDLVACVGAPTFTGVSAFGGGFAGAVSPTMTTRFGFATSGATCAPVIDGGHYRGCELGINCVGVDASGSSPLVMRNVNPTPGGSMVGVTGSTGAAETAIGLRCATGGCASITNSTITAGQLSQTGAIGIGVSIDGASPSVDSCRITGPNGGLVAPSVLTYYGLYLHTTRSTISNNVIHDGTLRLRVFDILYDMTPTAGGAGSPTVVNNTLDYNACATCGSRVGLVFFSNAVTQPSGVFRNNFIHNLAATGTTNPVIEANVNSDPLVFENNALFDATAASGTIYLDEASNPLMSAMAINMLNGMPAASTYSGNRVVDCMVNATFHLPAGSMCIDVGTNMSCPAADFEGTVRPVNVTCDIGADEFHP